MKKFGKTRFKAAWENLMDSTQKKFSRGASSITKIIAWARGDNWRRRQKELKPKKKDK